MSGINDDSNLEFGGNNDGFMGGQAPSSLDAFGEIVQGFGAFLQGKEKNAAFDYNASILGMMANQEMQAAGLQVDQIDKQETQLLSTQKAMYAKAGVTQAGSPTDVALQTATNFQFDKLVTNYNATIQAQKRESQAANERYYGRQAARAGKFAFAESLFKGVATIAMSS